MLELRPVCEHCGKALPNESDDAMMCTFECTFCASCVEEILNNVCPNCGGGFEKRPSRPKQLLERYPAKSDAKIKPINEATFKALKARNAPIPPRER